MLVMCGPVRWMARELFSSVAYNGAGPATTKETDVWSYGMTIIVRTISKEKLSSECHA